MKKLRQLSFIGLGIIFGLTSCTIQKRVYLTGYHFELNKNKHNSHKQELANKTPTHNQASVYRKPGTSINTVDNSLSLDSNEVNITASLNSSPIAPLPKTVSLNSESKVKKNYTSKFNTTVANNTTKTKINYTSEENKTTNISSKKSADSEGGKRGLLMIILALALIGIGYLLYISLGALGLILFLIFGIGGGILLIAGTLMILLQ